MNGFSRRVRTLYEKTHYFFSYQDLNNLKNYYKETVNNLGFEPEDLISEMNAFIRKMKESHSTESFRAETNDAQFYKANEAIFAATLYFSMFDYCEAYPHGVWLTRQIGKGFFDLAQKISRESKEEMEKKFNP